MALDTVLRYAGMHYYMDEEHMHSYEFNRSRGEIRFIHGFLFYLEHIYHPRTRNPLKLLYTHKPMCVWVPYIPLLEITPEQRVEEQKKVIDFLIREHIEVPPAQPFNS